MQCNAVHQDCLFALLTSPPPYTYIHTYIHIQRRGEAPPYTPTLVPSIDNFLCTAMLKGTFTFVYTNTNNMRRTSLIHSFMLFTSLCLLDTHWVLINLHDSLFLLPLAHFDFIRYFNETDHPTTSFFHKLEMLKILVEDLYIRFTKFLLQS